MVIDDDGEKCSSGMTKKWDKEKWSSIRITMASTEQEEEEGEDHNDDTTENSMEEDKRTEDGEGQGKREF